jgi:hypothetical protein
MHRFDIHKKKWRQKDEHSEKGRLIHVHPSWCSFIKSSESPGFGKIDKLKIQDGLPIAAEEIKSKVRFVD